MGAIQIKGFQLGSCMAKDSLTEMTSKHRSVGNEGLEPMDF